MPVEIKDLDGGLGTSIKGYGIVTEEELINELKKHLTQDKEKFKKYRYSISDYSAATSGEISTKSVHIVADLCLIAAKINPDIIVATVTAENLYFGLARMGEILRSSADWEEMVFRNIEDAKSWIKKRVNEKFGIETITFS